MTRARMILAALLALLPTAALAHGPNGHPADPNLHVGTGYDECFVKFAPELTQSAFRRFVREFGAVSAFKMVAPPTTLGRRGVAVGVEYISFSVEEKADAWNDTFAHPDQYHELGSTQSFPKVRLDFGVADNLDVGAFYTRNFQSNYGWLGVEAKYGLLRQSEDMPISLALRGAFTQTLYVDDMDMHALTADVAAGRTFGNVFTPYVGVGGDLIHAREKSDVVALHDETQPVSHARGGFEVKLWHVAMSAEAQQDALSSFQVQVMTVF